MRFERSNGLDTAPYKTPFCPFIRPCIHCVISVGYLQSVLIIQFPLPVLLTPTTIMEANNYSWMMMLYLFINILTV